MDKKQWILVDVCSTKAGAWWMPLDAETRQEAVEEAWRMWNSLTKYDQKRRDAFYVCLCEYDEDGHLNLYDEEDSFIIK